MTQVLLMILHFFVSATIGMELERRWHVFNYLPRREVWLCSVPRSQLKTVLSERVWKKDEPKRGEGQVIKRKCRLCWDAAWPRSDWHCAKSTRTTRLFCTTCSPQRTLTHKAKEQSYSTTNPPPRSSKKTPVKWSDTKQAGMFCSALFSEMITEQVSLGSGVFSSPK